MTIGKKGKGNKRHPDKKGRAKLCIWSWYTLICKKILRNTPMDRFGKAEELIGATLFLTNKELASFINGVVLPIDGGFSAYSGV